MDSSHAARNYHTTNLNHYHSGGAMLAKDLKAILDRQPERKLENLVAKVVVVSPQSVGSTPAVRIMNVQIGGDWDNNVLLLYPEENLWNVDETYLATLQEQAKKYGWDLYAIDNLKAEVKRLRKELAKYESK